MIAHQQIIPVRRQLLQTGDLQVDARQREDQAAKGPQQAAVKRAPPRLLPPHGDEQRSNGKKEQKNKGQAQKQGKRRQRCLPECGGMGVPAQSICQCGAASDGKHQKYIKQQG